jgi:DNA-binding transcriptional LysR family regulator
MKYFVDAARLENISRAAQINYVSQTAVSQQITSIEKELGIKLFFREKGRVRLTPAGVSFFNDCQEILTTYDQAVSKAKNIYNTQYGRGNILLGFSPASTIAYIDEVIAEFNRYYPDVSVKLLERNYAELRREMVDDTLHMAIAPDFIMEEIKGTESLFLAREEIGFLVPRRNPLAKNDTITIEEIKNEKIIMIGLESAGRAYDGMLAKRAQEGIIPVVAEVVRSAGLQTMLVAMGGGCASLPERLAL